MTDEYFAGLFDGEGCITIARGRTRGSVRPSFELRCIVNMTTPGLGALTALHRTYGGYLTRHCRRKGVLSEQQSWVATGAPAAAFLTRVLPYLLVKRDEAEYALEFHEAKLLLRNAPLAARDDKVVVLEQFKENLSAMKGRHRHAR